MIKFKKGCEEKSPIQVQCIIISLNRNFLDVQISGLLFYAAVTDLDFIYTEEKKVRTKRKRIHNTKQREITAI